jgi:hypothetical protein
MKSIQTMLDLVAPTEVETQPLYLPHHFSDIQRSELDITDLASGEAKLREGQAADLILQLRRVEKTLSAQHALRKKNASGQAQATRAWWKINQMEFTRDNLLATYEKCRQALKSLGHLHTSDANRERFPALTRADLFRKGTTVKWKLGDTYRPDGLLWVLEETSDVVGTYDVPAPAATMKRLVIQPSMCPSLEYHL